MIKEVPDESSEVNIGDRDKVDIYIVDKRISTRNRRELLRTNYYTLGGAPSLLPVITGHRHSVVEMSETCKKCNGGVKYKEDNTPYCLCTYESQLKRQKKRYDKNTHITVETINEENIDEEEMVENNIIGNIKEKGLEILDINNDSIENDREKDSENGFIGNLACQLTSQGAGAFSPASPANIDAIQTLRFNDSDDLRNSKKQIKNRNYSIIQGNRTPDIRKKIIDPDGPLISPMIKILIDQ